MKFMERVFNDLEAGNLSRGTAEERIHREYDNKPEVASIVTARHTYFADYNAEIGL